MQIGDAEVWPKQSRVFLLSAFLLLFSQLVSIDAAAQNAAPASATKEPGYYDPLPQDTGEAGLKQELRKLRNTGRLMMVVAHPDDEDGGLLTREARGQGVQTLLLTLTRGEGGQNETGDTFSDELGVLRTLELLASDRYYGVEQRFTRVADFGYSKSADETFQKWGGHDVPLADIVRVIRQFRPDVLVARFSGTNRDGHGHHQASSILTKEAFRAAADPNRFPEQIKEGLQPWQPKKLYIGNVCGFGAASCADENYTVKINTGEFDPVLGMSYAQFAGEGLKHQKSQGLADISIPAGPRYAFYKLADSVLPKTTDEKGHEKDLFDGIDTSLAGLAEQAKGITPFHDDLTRIAGQLRAISDNNNSHTLETLWNVLEDFHKINQTILDPASEASARSLNETMARIVYAGSRANAAINLASGATAKANTHGPAALSPGDRLNFEFNFENDSSAPVEIRYQDPSKTGSVTYSSETLAAGQSYKRDIQEKVPAYQYTKPYWHRDNPAKDAVYTIDVPRYATLPFPPFPFTENVAYRNHKSPNSPWARELLTVLGPQNSHDESSPTIPVTIEPAYAVRLNAGNQVVPKEGVSPALVRVTVTSNLDGAHDGVLSLDAPEGWRVTPAEATIALKSRGEKQTVDFQALPAQGESGRADLKASFREGKETYSEGYTLVTREDLGAFYYFEPAVQRISVVDVKVPKDLKVGYIMGAGDDIPTVLQQVGMNVTLIPAEKIAEENLAQYGTIVLGVRAYDTHKELVANNKKLLDFVSNGGTLIVQNNNSTGDFNSEHLTPYPAELSRARVSVEEAPVQILDPANAVFHYPNEISQKDFDGWVQERGLYFMDSWDDHFKPLLSCHDPGESDQKGGMIEAKYGKGIYIYSGYAFFRQLPAGVPGAIRLFVNLVSAGHER